MTTSIRTAVVPLMLCCGVCLAANGLEAADPPKSVMKDPLVPARRAFVPLRELSALVEQDRQGVLMPRAEFEALLKLAGQHVDAGSPPAAQVLSSCRYAATIVGDQLLITVTADLEQLAPHWKVWKFPLQRLALERATVNDQPALIGRTNDHALTVATNGRQTHRLKLEFATEIITVGSDRAAGFSLLPSASGELSLTVDAGKRLLVDGAELARPQPIEQPATYRVAVGGKPQVQLRITDRATDRTADALTFATTGYGLVVAPGEVTWHALTNLQIFGRPVDRLTMSVPGYLEIADVESTGLEAWELQDDPTNPQRTRITLTYGQPFEGARKIAVRGVMAVPTGTAWSAPPLTIETVNSHVGQVVVQHPAAVRLQVIEAEGVRRATEGQKPVSDMPEDMASGVAVQRLRFDAWREDFSLRLIAEPKQREVHAAIASVLDVASAEIQLQAALTVTPRYAPLFDLDVDLPAEWSVLGVVGADEATLTWRIVPQEPGRNRVRIPLPTALAPGASTVVKLKLQRDVEGWPVENEPVVFPLPELIAPQANVVETAFVIRGDADLELSTEEVSGLDVVPLKAEWERLRYQSQDTRYSAQVKVTRRRAQTAVETLGYYRLDRQTLSATVFAMLSISGGGVRELNISLPEATPATSRFQAAGGTLVEQQMLGVQNGRRQWRLQFAERVLGVLTIWTEITAPRTDAAAAVICPLMEVAGVDRSHGALVIEAGPDQRLTIAAASAQGLPLPEMDPLDLPPMPYRLKERIVAVHRTIGVGNTLTLTEQRFDKAPVPTAVCTKLDVLTVLSRTGELQQRAMFSLQLAGVQQLQVELPTGAELWAATLDDDPVEIRRTDGKLLIALPSESAENFAADLQVYYRSATSKLGSSGTLEEAPPALSVYAGLGSAQPVDVLEQTWEVVHPQDTLVIDSTSALEPTSALDQPGWLTHTADLVRLPRLEDAVWLVIGLVIVTGAYALLILIYRKLGVTRFWLALVGCGLLGLVTAPCLLAPAVQSARRSASSHQSAPNAWYGSSMPFPQSAAPAASYSLRDMDGDGSRVMVQDMDAVMPLEESRKELQDDLRSHITSRDRKILAEDARESELRRLDEQEARGFSKAKNEAGESDLPQAKQLEMAKSQSRARRQAETRRGDAAAEKSVGELAADDGINAPMAPPVAAPMPPAGADKAPETPPENYPAVDVLAAEGKSTNPTIELSLVVRQHQRLPSTQGLLSLSLALDRPEGTVEKTFRYIGGSGRGTGVPLQIEYVDRRGGAALRGFLFAVGLALGWWLRRCSAATKTAILVVGLSVGLGLAPAAPVTWQTTLDGIVFAVLGLVLGWTFFGAGRLLEACRRCCAAWTRTLPAILVLLLIAPAAYAQEKSLQPVMELPPIPPAQVLVYEDPDAPLAAERVFVPYTQFLELYRLAHPEHLQRSPAPTTAKLVESLYAASVVPSVMGTDPSVIVKARYTILSYVDGQQPVDLPISGVLLKSAQLDGAAAAMVTSAAPWKVLIPQSGLHVLDLEFIVPSQGSTAAGSFGMKLAATPAAKFAFTLPQPTLNARVNGSTSVFRRVTRDAVTSIEFPVDAGGDLQLAWQPEQARGGAAVVHVESVNAVSIVDAGISASVGFNFRIRQGIVRDVSFLLPEGIRLQGVTGPDVGGWELVGDAPLRKLRVFLRRNVSDATQLTLDAFLGQRIDQEVTFRVPEITPQEVTTEAGNVAVYVADAFSVRTENVSLLNQIDASKFEPSIPVSRALPTAQLAYRFSRRPWTLDVRASRLTTQLRATVQQGVLVQHRKVQLSVRARCELLRMPRSSLAVKVPREWLVLDVQSPGLVDWYSTPSEDGAVTVSLDYAGPQQGVVDIVLTATQPRAPEATLLDIGAPQILGAERQQTQQAVWLDEGLTAQAAELGAWNPLDATTISGELKQLRPTSPQLAFTSAAASPGSLQLALTRLLPRLSASSLTVVTVTDVALIYGCIFQWDVSRASTEVLTLETPAWLAGRLQFQGAEIRDVTPVAVDNQTTRWTITLRGPVSGRFRLAATASLPPATDRVPSPAVKFLTIEAGVSTPLETQLHYALLINTSLSQLTSVDPELVEPVQRTDVDLVVRQELVDQATEFVRLKNVGAAPSWSLQRYAPAAVIPAAVNLADLLTVIARDGSYHAVATYTIKNRSRQFLPVRLPEGARLLSVLVNRQASRAVLNTIGTGPAHLVALPKTSAVDLSFPVQVIYAGRLTNSLPVRSGMLPGEIDLPTAEIVGQDESPEYGIPVARTQWTVYLPDDLEATPLRDPLRHNLNAARQDTIEDSVVSVLLSDAEEIINATGSVNNYYGQARALNNLKQLDQALEGYAANTRGNAERAEQAQRLKSEVQKLERSLARGNRAGAAADPFGIQDRTEAESLNAAPQGGDANVQLGRAIMNNGALFDDNRNPDVRFGRNAVQDFGFYNFVPQTSSGTVTAEQLAQQAVTPTIQGNSLQARQMYQNLNDTQLDGLNSGIAAGKKSGAGANNFFDVNGNGVLFGQQYQTPGKPSSGMGFTSNLNPEANSPSVVSAPNNASNGVQRNYRINEPGMAGRPAAPRPQAGSREELSDRSRSPNDSVAGLAIPTDEFQMQAGAGGRGGVAGGGNADADVNFLALGDLDQLREFAEPQEAGWTQPGGLSLPIELPTAGQKLMFSKAGSDARLALHLRTRQSLQRVLGIAWAAMCIGAAGCMVFALQRPQWRAAIVRRLPLVVAGVAAMGALFLVSTWSTVAIFVFVIAAGVAAWMHRDRVEA
ncbi:MAG: hypothetical protein SFV23_17825 [Planctomycetaceae bacterium]|nr:hypothetical protein [Planctomycetaceae bacterium]